MNYRISPSILSADFARLGEEVKNVIAAGADLIHFDVMDNHYVPNLTFGPMICEAIKPYATVPMDVHLMVEPVDDLIVSFAKAGANIITFHPDATHHVDRSLGLIKAQNCQAGLVLNPATPLHVLDYVLDKTRALRLKLDEYAKVSGRHIAIEVDGGIKVNNIAEVAAAGADTFVAGSAIFGQDDYQAVIAAMRAELKKLNS